MAVQCGDRSELSRREELAVRLAEAVTETPGDVSEDFYAELREEFSAAQLVELTSAFCWKNYLARFNRVYEVPEQEYPLK
jgi:alkylhydroperoxidase family enzyme